MFEFPFIGNSFLKVSFQIRGKWNIIHIWQTILGFPWRIRSVTPYFVRNIVWFVNCGLFLTATFAKMKVKTLVGHFPTYFEKWYSRGRNFYDEHKLWKSSVFIITIYIILLMWPSVMLKNLRVSIRYFQDNVKTNVNVLYKLIVLISKFLNGSFCVRYRNLTW